MFELGELVVCGSKGVCTVEEVTKLNMPGVNRERDYYVLKPVYNFGTTVYIPVDTGNDSMRKILSLEEAKELIHTIRDIQPITIANDKLLEQEYRGCLKTNLCEEWVKIIKEASDGAKGDRSGCQVFPDRRRQLVRRAGSCVGHAQGKGGGLHRFGDREGFFRIIE